MANKTVAVIGASADRSKFSNKAVRAFQRQGWDVYPVNAKGGKIEGLTAYATIDQIPAKIDCVTLYLPPQLGLQALPGIAQAKPAEFYVNPGAESDALVAEAKKLGLQPTLACSIIQIGASPSDFPSE